MLQSFDPKNADLIVNINGRLVHRDEAGVSPFDSAVQGGDAVWEGLRLYDGRIFRLREHLDRLRQSALALAFRDIPTAEAITDRDPPDAGGQRHDRRRAHPPDADARRQDHQRHGPAAQPVGADADRAGRAQAARLRHGRPHADDRSHPPVAARLPRSEDPPQQPAPVDPRQDRGQRRRRRRRADARHARLRRRDQRHAPVLRRARRRADADHRRLPRRHHPRRGARAVRARTASRTR